MNYDLFIALESNKDDEQAKKMASYMKDNFPFLGIPKPKQKEIMKPYFKNLGKIIDWDFVFECFNKNYREAQYASIDYLAKMDKYLIEEDLSKLKTLITTKSWWDSVDNIDGFIGKMAVKYPSIHQEMLKWSVDENMWLRRVAINYQQKLNEDTNKENLALIIVNNLGSKEFFINKAIGWSLREYKKTNEMWVMDFIKKYNDKLATLSIKEALKN